MSDLAIVSSLVSEYAPDLSFTMFEIGARGLDGKKEPFYELLEMFPKSRVIAFEVEKKLCDEMNHKTLENVTFYPTALGLKDGMQKLFVTTNPECCSLYKPNVDLLVRFNGLEAVMPKSEYEIQVMSLDNFVAENTIENIDFIKIDIQGAENDVFKGGLKALKDTVLIVSEVEFIPLYEDQPLFGDVCQQLSQSSLMFHKFLGFGGRTLKPIILENDINTPSQHMWSDAVYIKNLDELDSLSSDKLLKLALLALIYRSPDVTFHCFKIFDQKNKTDLLIKFSRLVS